MHSLANMAGAFPLPNLMFLLVGLMIISFGLHLFYKSIHMSSSGKLADGTIIGNREKELVDGKSGKASKVFAAEIEFEAKGAAIRFVNEFHRGWRYKTGTKVKVFHDPLAPGKAPQMKSIIAQWIAPGLILMLGTSFLFIAIR